jgi:hypothetical protein
LVGEHERVNDHVLAELGRASFDHHDRVTTRGDEEVEVRVRAFRERGVENELAVDAADANAGVGAGPGDVGKVQRR